MDLCESCKNWYKLNVGLGWEEKIGPTHCHHPQKSEIEFILLPRDMKKGEKIWIRNGHIEILPSSEYA